MQKLLFDGIEQKAFEENIELKCKKCHKSKKYKFKNILDSSSNYKSNKYNNNFLYSYDYSCNLKHKTTYIYRFEEVQPSRYQIEIIEVKLAKLESRPRKIINAILLILLIIIVPLTVIWINTSTILSYLRYKEINNFGLETTAKIVDKYSDPGGVKRAAIYELTYEYDIENQKYIDNKKVDINTFNLNDIGDEVSIKYDQNDPSISEVDNNEDIYLDLFLLILVDGLLVISIIWIYIRSKKETK